MMTQEQFEREKNYRITAAIAKEMLKKGIITGKEYKKINTKAARIFRPIFGSL